MKPFPSPQHHWGSASKTSSMLFFLGLTAANKLALLNRTTEQTGKNEGVGLYLMESVFEQQGQEFNHGELGVGFDPSEVDAHKETEEICELLNVATRERRKH